VLEKSKKKQKHMAETKMLRFVCQTRRKNSFFFLFSKFLFRQTLFYILKGFTQSHGIGFPTWLKAQKLAFQKEKSKIK